jgi:hypothetical protein
MKKIVIFLLLVMSLEVYAQKLNCPSPRSKVEFELKSSGIKLSYCQIRHKGSLVKDGIYISESISGVKTVKYYEKGIEKSVPSESVFYKKPPRQFSQSSCPEGYLYVSDSKWGDSFCVSKLEMREGVIPNEKLRPIIEKDPRRAAQLCNSVTVPGFKDKFRLISNNQWMAVANEIELNEDNWQEQYSGGVNIRCLSIGNNNILNHFKGIKMCGYRLKKKEGYDWGENRNSEACHKLKSKKEICDLAGNLHEWVSWTSGKSYSFLPKNYEVYNSSEASAPSNIHTLRGTPELKIVGALEDKIFPAKKYKREVIPGTSDFPAYIGMGNVLARNPTKERGILRGGSVNFFGGIYTFWAELMVKDDGSYDYSMVGYVIKEMGFRCIYKLD